VESIENDGTVVITDKAASIFKKLLDYDCKKYTVENSEAKAKELDAKFKNGLPSINLDCYCFYFVDDLQSATRRFCSSKNPRKNSL